MLHYISYKIKIDIGISFVLITKCNFNFVNLNVVYGWQNYSKFKLLTTRTTAFSVFNTAEYEKNS